MFLIHHPDNDNEIPDLRGEGARDMIACFVTLDEAVAHLPHVAPGRRTYGLPTGKLWISDDGRRVVYPTREDV